MIDQLILRAMLPGREFTREDIRNRIKDKTACLYPDDEIRDTLRKLGDKGRIISAQVNLGKGKVSIYRLAK